MSIASGNRALKAATGAGSKAANDWRDMLSLPERVQLEAMETNAQHLDAKRRALSKAIRTMRVRAIMRRRYAARRKEAAA